MEKALEKTFNEEVNKYRNLLLGCAKKSEWNTFKVNAGKLFDYCESIEMSVLRKKFFGISKVIMIALVFVVVLVCRMNPSMQCEIPKIRELLILGGICGCSFQLYFFLNFRKYMERKMTSYKYRRDRFIRSIEADFRTY